MRPICKHCGGTGRIIYPYGLEPEYCPYCDGTGYEVEEQKVPPQVKNAAGRLGSKGWSYKEINDLAGLKICNEKGVI